MTLWGSLPVAVRAADRPVHRGAVTGDDGYVRHTLASSYLPDVLYAFNVDLVKGEGGEPVWYEGFDPLQPRYVRVVPSGLMAIEFRTSGAIRSASDGLVARAPPEPRPRVQPARRPLAAYDFLHVSGCVEVGRWRP